MSRHIQSQPISLKMWHMGRKHSPERLAAFEALDPEELYTASQIADLAKFDGSKEEMKRKRRNFRANLSSFYKPTGDPDDFVHLKGQGPLSPAWYGKAWRKSAGLDL